LETIDVAQVGNSQGLDSGNSDSMLSHQLAMYLQEV
jgi:hypothetical protein